MVIDLIGKQYEEETHILARVRLNQLRVNRQKSGTAFHKRAGAASATNSVSLGCDCRAMELWRGPRENRRAHGSSIHRTDATRSRPGQPRCHRRAQPFARRKRGNRAGAASAPPNGAAMISQYLGLAFKDVPKHDKAHPSPSTHATPSDTFFDLYKKNIFSPSPSP